ncbi:hypothetical protein B0J11DRAFT_321175 [Dendryphion nanum]|uniref:GH16 domain-containing protein n=1 Tax=Dendryphion nanum TaxID=256645 RepID=A0A9P9DRM2_9PLEO|nr:hypothetical protein B0J11DRAFT_321175 [Dendryphion nanum]
MIRLTVCSFSLALVTRVMAQQYGLVRTYTPHNFFEEFRFFTAADPTGGFVQYVPYEIAAATGLIGNSSNGVYLGVDKTNVYPSEGPGRRSVRLESKSTFSEGLFVADLSHIPIGCGVWPGFWTVGLGDWPADGEIDIVENINDAEENNAALHAAGECIVEASAAQSGSWKSIDCNIVHDDNQGCGARFNEPNTYGAGFNKHGGGVYAMEWTRSFVKIWFFPPNNIPQSLNTTGSFDPLYSHPDPVTFGPPSVHFEGPCSSSFGDKFFNHTIIFDTTFCGGWAGGNFGDGESSCPILEGKSPQESCVNFVGNNPESFKDAYWGINSLRVWQKIATLYDTNQTAASVKSTSVAALATADTIVVPLVPIQDSVPIGVKVSPLSGGELTLQNQTPKPFPILDPGIGSGTTPPTFLPVPDYPIQVNGDSKEDSVSDHSILDPGIGDGTFPPTSQSVSISSPPSAWNTEGKIPDDGFLSSPDLSDVIPSALNELPVIASLWSGLQNDAQAKLLALASQLVVGGSVQPASAEIPDQVFPIAAKEQTDIVPASETVIPVTSIEQSVPLNLPEQPLVVGGIAGLAPIDIVDELPIIEDITPLAPEDTSQAISSIVEFLDDSTKSYLLTLLSPVAKTSTGTSRHQTHDRDGEIKDTGSHLYGSQQYPKFCNYPNDSPSIGSVTWVLEFIRNYYIFNQIFEASTLKEQIELGSIIMSLVDTPVSFYDEKSPCEGISSIGSPTWIADFVSDYRLLVETLVGINGEERDQIYALVEAYIGQKGTNERWSLIDMPLEGGELWESYTEEALSELIKEGSRPLPLDPIPTHIARLVVSNDDHSNGVSELNEILDLVFGFPEGYTPDRHRHKRDGIQSLTAYDPQSETESEEESVNEHNHDTQGGPSWRYKHKHRPHHHYKRPPVSKGPTWEEVYASLDPQSRQYADNFLALYNKFGQKPAMSPVLEPYVEYIEGWQDNYHLLDETIQGELLQWIIQLKRQQHPEPRNIDEPEEEIEVHEADTTEELAEDLEEELDADLLENKEEEEELPSTPKTNKLRPEGLDALLPIELQPFPTRKPPKPLLAPLTSSTKSKPKSNPEYFESLSTSSTNSLEGTFDDPATAETTDDFAYAASSPGFPWSKGPNKSKLSPWSKTPENAGKKIEQQYNDLALWDSLPKDAKEGILDTLAEGPDVQDGIEERRRRRAERLERGVRARREKEKRQIEQGFVDWDEGLGDAWAEEVLAKGKPDVGGTREEMEFSSIKAAAEFESRYGSIIGGLSALVVQLQKVIDAHFDASDADAEARPQYEGDVQDSDASLYGEFLEAFTPEVQDMEVNGPASGEMVRGGLDSDE